MRQEIKDYKFYERRIQTVDLVLQQSHKRMSDGFIPSERFATFYDSKRSNKLTKTILKYTFGEPIEEVKREFKNVIKYANENWVGLWILKLSANKFLKQYTLSGYDEMLSMLSLSYLLDIDELDFRKLVDLIDQDGIKDYLFEFIIRAKIKDRKPIFEESYQDYFGVPKVFKKLREAILEIDKTKSEKLVKEFIRQEWYRNHKGQGWYDCHKSIHDVYYGYWSFETAAVVKIMRLDDSTFLDCQYYPKDLVHQENN